ncbi:DUF7537 family lipoprotein [Halostella salina]|uniref:DUF7537 family lipoprotein n=1 Tax=Halostella salina TaxID=1547897 RepID=UPI000EF7E5F5|nr:hypothetical protein [Halostella salina]
MRWKRAAAVGLVVSMVLLAGCSGIFGGDATETPTSDTTAGEVTNDTPANATTPPGVAGGELANATALTAAHNASLSGEAFALQITQRNRLSQGGQNVTTGADRAVAVGDDGRFVIRASNSRVNQTVWGNESVAVSRTVTGGEPAYETMDPDQLRPQLSGHLLLSNYLSAGSYEVASTETVDGETVTTLRSTGYTGSDAIGIDPANVSVYESTATVGPDGRVRELAVHLEGSSGGSNVTLDVRFELDADGSVDVSRPGWTDEV